MNPARPRGAQRERTALAWRRTALAIAVNGILMLRSPNSWIEVAACVVLALSVAMAGGAAIALNDPASHGWIGTSRRRATVLVVLVAGVALLDIFAIAYNA